MTVAQTRAAGRKMQKRYRPGKRRSVHEAIAAERMAAKRSANIVRKKK